MSLVKFYKFPPLGDKRGSLVVIDEPSGAPFEIKRIYYMYGTKKGVLRGLHAHKKLHQIAVCVSGSCRMLLDNGFSRESVLLDSPLAAIDLPPMVWHEVQDFSQDSVLLILANEYYEENDYIRNYNEFLEELNK